LDILTKRPVNDFSISRNQSQGFFCYTELLPKRCRRDLNPFGNKIFAVEFMQLAQSACEQSLTYERLIMGAFFVFRKHDVVAVCPKGSKDAANKGK